MKPNDVLGHVEQLEQEQLEARKFYQYCEEEIEQRPGSPERKLYWRLALASGRQINKARLAWCREAKTAIQEFVATSNKIQS